jgi:DNA-binding IclR family transcriptional regulator
VDQGLLQRQGTTYSIGLRVIAWSAAASAGSNLVAIAGPRVAALRDLTGESCGIYVRNGATRVAVVSVESNRSIIYRGYVGQVMPLHAGAAGKVFMAYDPQALADALAEGLHEYTPSTVTDPALLARQLERVRQQGWAFAEEEREQGLNSIAAPVFDHSGQIAATVAVGGPSFRLNRSGAKRCAGYVTECAAEISRGLLWQGPEEGAE